MTHNESRALLPAMALAMAGLVFSPTAQADDYRLYDDRGRYIGKLRKDGNTQRLYDDRGRYQGKIRDDGDTRRLYDDRGQYRGKVRTK